MTSLANNTPKVRELTYVTSGQRTSDGADVKMTRMIGTPELNTLDPFLLLDVFETEESNDYIGGFPDHPHRGFETVTYLLNGRMRHKDNAGNEGVIEPGGVQWMTAGRGIVHSEMPEQEDGLLQGFQLWVNLPAKDKMTEPAYQEFTKTEISTEHHDNGTEIKVISGTTVQGTRGPIINTRVAPLFLDVKLANSQRFNQTVNKRNNAFIYLLYGELSIAESNQILHAREFGVLEQGDEIQLTALEDSHFILVAANPLNEPIARGGPFVMNTKAEVLQAFEDFQNNEF